MVVSEHIHSCHIEKFNGVDSSSHSKEFINQFFFKMKKKKVGTNNSSKTRVEKASDTTLRSRRKRRRIFQTLLIPLCNLYTAESIDSHLIEIPGVELANVV